MKTPPTDEASGGPALSRRGFLQGSAAALAALAAGGLSADPGRTRYLLSGCFDVEAGAFRIGVVDLIARTRRDIPVDRFGHGLCLHPTRPGHALLFAQRPGTVSYEFDYVNARLTREFETRDGRYFYGHGLGVAGRGVLCAEYTHGEGSGVVVIRNPDTYEVVGEFPSHGTGPHDLRFLDGGRTLAVANGGLAADTDTGPLDKRVPGTLALLDAATGELRERTEFPGMSLKHMHATPAGTLALALRGRADALVMVRHADGTLVRAHDPGGLFAEMRHHTLSIRACDRTGLVACSSPKGGLVGFWDMGTGELRHVERFAGARGIVLSDDQQRFFITTHGRGKLVGLTNETVSATPGDGELVVLDSATARPVPHGLPNGPRTLWLSHALGVVAPRA